MSIYYNDYGKRKTERKTNAGANKQFEQIVKDVSSFQYNIPMPPTNADGSFKSVNQMVDDRDARDWRRQKKYAAAVAAHEEEIRDDPEQIAWEREQRRTGRRSKESRGIPFIVKIIIAIPLLMLSSLFGSDIVLFVVGIGIFAWIAL